ncbi:MAG: 16S rRNA (cytidine(1402)-2'-O)-methyltransferase [Acholeplasma sp.]
MNIQVSYDEPKPTLYVVSTPIGNLKDITLRALETLRTVDMILCEDTRVTSRLTSNYQIEVPLKSYQKFNEHAMVDFVVEQLSMGLSLALVSDAGTPLISDPGFILIDALIQKNFNVVSIPGASAALSALVSSGLLTQPFTFLGFLPRKVGEIKTVLENYIDRTETLIIYESPNRMEKTLKIMFEVLGNKRVSIARELTKKFETYYRGLIGEFLVDVLDKRGEYVIVVEGATKKVLSIQDPVQLVNLYIDQGLTEKDAIKQASRDLGVHKSEVYKVFKID